MDRLDTLLASYTYTVNPAGRRTALVELNGRRHDYAYDAIYRLTSETVTAVSGDPAIAGTINYSLDAVGNRLARNSSVPSVPSASHSFDANDRLASDSYDANGNTVASASAGPTSNENAGDVYDFENRLIRRTTTRAGQSLTIDLLYDCAGHRVSETVAATGGTTNTVTFLVDTLNVTGYAQVVEERVNGVLTRTYAYGHALLSQMQAALAPSWITTYYSHDGHGSTRLLTDALGVVTDTYSYDAFGIQIASTSAAAQPTFNRYRYVGEQHDDDLGLIYLRARYMNPASGRFWSADSFEGSSRDPGSLHRYLYASADPVGRIDPSGNISLGELAVSAGISGTINAALAIPTIYRNWNTMSVADIGEKLGVEFASGAATGIIGGLAGKLALKIAGPGVQWIFKGALEGGAGAAGSEIAKELYEVIFLHKPVNLKASAERIFISTALGIGFGGVTFKLEPVVTKIMNPVIKTAQGFEYTLPWAEIWIDKINPSWIAGSLGAEGANGVIEHWLEETLDLEESP